MAAAGKQPTQEQRIEAARHRCGVEPSFALRVLTDIYRRNKPAEIRQYQHLGHDNRGFREEDLGHLVRVVERLLAHGRWDSTNLTDKHLVMREGRRYAAQWVRWQDAMEKARQEHMAYTTALLDGEPAPSSHEAAPNGQGGAEQGSTPEPAPVATQAPTAADSRAAQKAETMRKFNERHSDDPTWGALAARFAGGEG